MTIDEFEEWLMNLPLQTLTDDLKSDILVNVIALERDSNDMIRARINREINDYLRKYKK